MIGNHTCSHPRFEKVGFKRFSEDASKGDVLLKELMPNQKFFRFPFLNESKNVSERDQMRKWLDEHHYRNGYVSVDNDDYLVSWALEKSIQEKKNLDREKLNKIFLDHVMGAVRFYDDLAIKTLGYSPKHVLLLHEKDMTVMNLESLVTKLKAEGWIIISPEEAYKDPLYRQRPKNTYSGNGIVAQVHFEKTGVKKFFDHQLKEELDQMLK